MPGVFLGVGEAGKVKHAVDAGDATANLSVVITSCKFSCLPCFLAKTASAIQLSL